MARVLEEYSRVPPRHAVPRRADHLVSVRSVEGGASAGEAGVGRMEGYEVEVVALTGPKCVGVNLR
jgi:hypothetical protein